MMIIPEPGFEFRVELFNLSDLKIQRTGDPANFIEGELVCFLLIADGKESIESGQT